MMRKIFITILGSVSVAILIFGAVVFIDRASVNIEQTQKKSATVSEIVEEPKKEEPAPAPEPIREKLEPVIKEVPFVVQAPFGEWSDEHFQNACEEASVIMVEHWYKGLPIVKEEAKKEILAMETYEEKEFGTSIDTSIDDTQKLLEEFAEITGSRVERDVTIADIIQAVEGNSVVIIPADGRKLKNPNFRPPGPTRHMLVVISHDPVSKEFITNDPGTRNGKSYRYDEALLYDAILDYKTGDHLPVTNTNKVMLVVSKP